MILALVRCIVIAGYVWRLRSFRTEISRLVTSSARLPVPAWVTNWLMVRAVAWSARSRTVSGHLSAVGDHREGVSDEEDAVAPGQRDPDIGADRLAGEQVADVDDESDRLVLGEPAHRTWQGVGGTKAELRKGKKISG